jgi:hypothetical protein
MLAIAAFAVTMTACGTTASTTTGASASTLQGPAASSGISVPSVDAAQPISGAEMAGHIHNLAYDGRRLLIGTHEGLWGQAPGAKPAQLSDDAFDVMGLTIAGERWLASGHPEEGMDAPADLGLLQSTDRGRTWAEVSLGGEVDFHRLAASGGVVVGVNAHDGRLLRSGDGGTAWIDLGVPGLYDLAVSPADPAVIVGTSESGPVRSIDSGARFNAVGGAPLLALLAWTGDTLYGADLDGRIHESTDDGITWKPLGSLPSQPSAFAATGTTVAALVGDTVLESVDGGASFTPRITGLGGH